MKLVRLMWKKVKGFLIEWERSMCEMQKLEMADKYCRLYSNGKINKKIFVKLVGTLND